MAKKKQRKRSTMLIAGDQTLSRPLQTQQQQQAKRKRGRPRKFLAVEEKAKEEEKKESEAGEAGKKPLKAEKEEEDKEGQVAATQEVERLLECSRRRTRRKSQQPQKCF